MKRRFFFAPNCRSRFLASARVAASLVSSIPEMKPLSGRDKAGALAGRSENHRSIFADEDSCYIIKLY